MATTSLIIKISKLCEDVLCTLASSTKQIKHNWNQSWIERGEAFFVNCGRQTDRQTDRRTLRPGMSSSGLPAGWANTRDCDMKQTLRRLGWFYPWCSLWFWTYGGRLLAGDQARGPQGALNPAWTTLFPQTHSRHGPLRETFNYISTSFSRSQWIALGISYQGISTRHSGLVTFTR